MADNKKISELDDASLPLSGTELVAIVQGGENKKVSVSEIGGGSDFDPTTDTIGDITPNNSAIADNDTVTVAFGKAQGQNDATNTALSNHVSNTSNPHNVTKSQVGLGNVPNTDATNPANINQTATYRFVSDTEKSTWNGKQDALLIASDAEMQAGTNNTKYATPLRIASWWTWIKTQAFILSGVITHTTDIILNGGIFEFQGTKAIQASKDHFVRTASNVIEAVINGTSQLIFNSSGIKLPTLLKTYKQALYIDTSGQVQATLPSGIISFAGYTGVDPLPSNTNENIAWASSAIKANTISLGSYLFTTLQFQNGTSSGSKTIRLYLSPSPSSIASAVIYATFTYTGTTTYYMTRTLRYFDLNNFLVATSPTSSAQGDLNNAIIQLYGNVSADLYIVATVQKTTGSDQFYIYSNTVEHRAPFI